VKNLIKVGVGLAALATLLTSAAASTPIIGVWKGHISFDSSKLPNISDPNQKKLAMDQVKAAGQIKITLTLKGDHTFSLISIGGPKQMAPLNGTYTASGSSVTITAKGQTTPQTFALSKDSHSMSLSQGALNITFSK